MLSTCHHPSCLRDLITHLVCATSLPTLSARPHHPPCLRDLITHLVCATSSPTLSARPHHVGFSSSILYNLHWKSCWIIHYTIRHCRLLIHVLVLGIISIAFIYTEIISNRSIPTGVCNRTERTLSVDILTGRQMLLCWRSRDLLSGGLDRRPTNLLKLVPQSLPFLRNSTSLSWPGGPCWESDANKH